MLRSASEENTTFKWSNRPVTRSARLHSPLLITQCGAEERCAHDTSGRTDVQRFERFEIESVEVGGGLGENQPALNIWHAGERPLESLGALRSAAALVRVVRAPHHPVEPQVGQELRIVWSHDTRPMVNVATNVFAGLQ